MKKYEFLYKVMFSDCDPAKIVFYPKYFQWFDIATQKMFNLRTFQPRAQRWALGTKK